MERAWTLESEKPTVEIPTSSHMLGSPTNSFSVYLFYLDSSGGFTGVWVCSNPSNCAH